jgi:ATP-dependent DNA helicase RecG
LVEGRKPNYFLSANVSQKIGQKAEYTKNKALEKSYYLELIEKAIIQHGFVERYDIDELLWKKLPEWMNEKQKKTRINHLLAELRANQKIINIGNDRNSKWILKID